MISHKTKIFFYILLIALFWSCGGGSDEPDIPSTEYLNVTSQVKISGGGGLTGTLEIKADCGWTISGNPSWMTLSANSGSGNANILITCTSNPSSTDERSAVLTVSSASGKIKRQVTVSQPISIETIETNKSELQFEADGGVLTLTVTANAKWTIQGIDEWFTLSRQEGEGNADVTVIVSQNPSENPRQSTLTIQGERSSSRVTIKQEGRSTTLAINPNTITASAVSNVYALTIEGDATWSASSNVSWAILSKTTGTGDATVSVTVLDNTSIESREGILTFSTSQHTYFCTIKQQAGRVPTVSITTISDVEKYSVKASANYESEFVVIECGFCYSESNLEPTVGDNFIRCTDSTMRNFSALIDNLLSGHNYYVRAYAKNGAGINYGPSTQIKTSGSIPGSEDNPTPGV